MIVLPNQMQFVQAGTEIQLGFMIFRVEQVILELQGFTYYLVRIR